MSKNKYNNFLSYHSLQDPVHFCHNHYNGGDKRRKRDLTNTSQPMANFTITPVNMNGTNSSSPFVITSAGTSATIELIVSTSTEEEDGDSASTDNTGQKLFVVSCCEKEDDDADTTPMIDLFLLPTEEEDGEDYEVIDVYVMPTPQQKEVVDYVYEDRVIRASASKTSYDTYSPIPPPCLPTEITQLCSSVCDHPGATALVLGLLAILLVVEVMLLAYLGSLVKGAINRCRKNRSGGEETRVEEGGRSHINMAMSDSDSYPELVINKDYCNSVAAQF